LFFGLSTKNKKRSNFSELCASAVKCLSTRPSLSLNYPPENRSIPFDKEMTQRNHTGSQEKNRPRGFYPFLLCVLDFVLLNVSFFALNYWKRGTFDLSSRYFNLLIAFYVIWFLVAIFTKKFRVSSYGSYWNCIALYVRSGFYGIYCAAFVVVMFSFSEFSRLHAFGTWALLSIQEGVIFTLYYVVAGKGRRTEDGARNTGDGARNTDFSRFLLVADFVLVGISFFLVNYLKRGNLYLLPEYEKLLLIIYGLWFGTSLATRKYVRRAYQNYYHGLWPWIKTAILMVVVMSVVVFGLRIFYFSRAQVFGTILVLVILEVLFFGFYFIFKKQRKAGQDIESVDDVKVVLGQSKLPAEIDLEDIRRFLMEPVRRHLKGVVLKNDPDVFAMLDQSVNLEEIVHAETAVFNSNSTFHLGLMATRALSLFINLNKVNNNRWINRYFLSVYESLTVGGFFFGKAHTIYTHKKWIYKKYPKQIANGIYLVDFLVNRICPKIPFTKQIYFAVTKGKGRVISKAEILGRLCFCGFDIVAEKEINERLYFLACKSKTSSIEQNPSYGPLIKLNRVGFNGNLIKVYKFRTMHPYSEYLQEYIYENHGIQNDGDKFLNDFRLTEWGKLMRNLWIDEIPMLYNLICGDIKLVGVRPLSEQKLSIYDKSVKELRSKHKPGLIPPKYADMPDTFEDFMKSEEKYLKAFEKHPVVTDFRYFFKVMFNIIFRAARSR
jgi:lipopolysaccharide/colanic/teichoic acid biosynthesis glycosyltransferase